MDAEEAKERLKELTGIKDEDALYDLINKCYHALPAAIRHKRIDDDFEVTVLEEIFISEGKSDSGLTIIPESVLKRIKSMVDESKANFGETAVGMDNEASKKDAVSEEELDEEILKDIGSALGKSGVTEDPNVPKEKKDVIFLVFCGAMGEKPVGFNFNDRLVIFNDKKSIPNDLIGRTIKRKGVTIEVKEDKTCEVSGVMR